MTFGRSNLDDHDSVRCSPSCSNAELLLGEEVIVESPNGKIIVKAKAVEAKGDYSVITVQEKDLVKIALLRRLYEVFRGPDQAGVHELCEGNWISDVEETMAVLALDRPAGWNDLLKYLESRCLFSEQMLEELVVEHTRLFINTYGGTPAPPYGSVYLNDWPSLDGKVALQVIEWYKRAGVALPPDYPEPPDYLPIELEFIIHLIQSVPETGTGAAAEELRKVWGEFTKEHFSRWVPIFTKRVNDESKNPLYAVAGQLLEVLVAEKLI